MTDELDLPTRDARLADHFGIEEDDVTESTWRHYFDGVGTGYVMFDLHEIGSYDGPKFRAVVVKPKQQYHIVSDVALSFGDWSPFECKTASTREDAMHELARLAGRDEDE